MGGALQNGMEGRDFSPEAINAAEVEQYGFAVELTEGGHYVNVSPDDYYFDTTHGLSVLYPTVRETDGDFCVLDIGYGNGEFLRETANLYPKAKCIGIAAVSRAELEGADAQVIEGDIVRADTWRSARLTDVVPSAQTVDVAVSHLTFMHLSNPPKGLANVLKLMKPSGRLYIDHVRIRTDPVDKKAVSDVLRQIMGPRTENGSLELRQSTDAVRVNFPVFLSDHNTLAEELGSALKPYVNDMGRIAFVAA